MKPVPIADPLIEDLARMAAEEAYTLFRGSKPPPPENVARLFRAAIEAYMLFRESPGVVPSAN